MNQKSVSGLGLALMLMAAIGLGGSTANAVSGSQPAPSLNRKTEVERSSRNRFRRTEPPF